MPTHCLRYRGTVPLTLRIRCLQRFLASSTKAVFRLRVAIASFILSESTNYRSSRSHCIVQLRRLTRASSRHPCNYPRYIL